MFRRIYGFTIIMSDIGLYTHINVVVPRDTICLNQRKYGKYQDDLIVNPRGRLLARVQNFQLCFVFRKKEHFRKYCFREIQPPPF